MTRSLEVDNNDKNGVDNVRGSQQHSHQLHKESAGKPLARMLSTGEPKMKLRKRICSLMTHAIAHSNGAEVKCKMDITIDTIIWDHTKSHPVRKGSEGTIRDDGNT
jgi:hypothetical protein